MKRAVLFPERNLSPGGPIPRAIIDYALNNDVDILGLQDDPDFDEYDSAVIFVNRSRQLPRSTGSCKTGWWMCDFRHPSELGNTDVDLDAIFLCSEGLRRSYEKVYGASAYYMPQVGLIEPIKRGRPINWDVVFIGNVDPGKWHMNRMDILSGLQKKLSVKIVSQEKYTKDTRWLYNESPFCLSISPQAAGYTSNRTYNILSSGGFCLILWFPGIERLFENHKHLVWFDTPEEAYEIVEYYYRNPDKWRKIRENGYKLYKEKHTIQHRMDNMFEILEGKCNKFKGYL